MKKLPSNSQCTGCMACHDVCMHDAIQFCIDDAGFYIRLETTSKCIDCGLCEKVCPVINAPIKINNIGIPFVAINNNMEQLLRSSSGGVASALSSTMLQKSGVVVGVSLGSDDNKPKHVIVKNNDDLYKVQGSKYLQSDCKGIFKKVRTLLKSNYEVLFTGTPCQISALYHYLCALKTDTSNLVTLEIICHGVPTFKLLELLKSGYEKKIKKIVSYRDKDYGWNSNYMAKLEFEDGSMSHDDKKIFSKGFVDFKLIRSSCLNCRFRGIQRESDVTCGDYWGGDTKQFPEYKNGCSILLVNSVKGMTLVEQSNMHIEKTDFSFLKRNANLICVNNIYRYHPLRLFLKFNLKSLSKKTLCQLYCNANSTSLFVKLMRYVDLLFWKLLHYYRMKQYMNFKQKYNV